MKKTVFTAVAALLACSAALNAQEPESSYLLDNYAYINRTSPALSDTTVSGVAALGLGYVGVGAYSNLGVKSILFPRDGNLVTGLNEKVSADEFLSGLKDNSRIMADVDYNILSMHSRTDMSGRYVSFEINLKSHNDVYVPKEVFEIFKVGTGPADHYDFPSAGASSSSWLEIAGGTEFRPGDFTIAFRAKFLLGAADARLSVDDTGVSVAGGSPSATVDANLLASKNTFSIQTTASGALDFGTIAYAGVEPAGYGAGLDLGVSWKPSRQWTVTASLLDFGGIWWTGDLSAKSALRAGAGQKTSANDLLRFVPDDTPHGTYFKGIPFTVNAGFRYKPAELVTIGSRAYWRHGEGFNLWHLSAGAGLNPCRQFGLAANMSAGNDGLRAGGSMCFRLAFIQFFVSAEATLTRFTYNHIPINPPGVVVATGLSFTFRRK